jgi:hypothetical protein
LKELPAADRWVGGLRYFRKVFPMNLFEQALARQAAEVLNAHPAPPF